jgi:hypothetical protein
MMALAGVKEKLRKRFETQKDMVVSLLQGCNVRKDIMGDGYIVCPAPGDGDRIFSAFEEHSNIHVASYNSGDGSLSCKVCSGSPAQNAFEGACLVEEALKAAETCAVDVCDPYDPCDLAISELDT